jgi:hypothetical protein
MSDTNQISSEAKLPSAGPYIARVVSHLDKTYMGQLQVELLRTGSGNTPSESSLHRVKYMSPFYGVTPETALGIAPDDYNETQKSYGMWMVPPDVGTRVMVIFVDSNPKDGYWIGCIMDEAANFMVPGIAATQKVVEDPEADNAGNLGRVPVAEYNKKAEKTGQDIGEIVVNATNAWKPKHPLADVLIEQGLVFDDSRGITTSSARREIPSMVFGISTPGPVDRRPGAKQAPIGKSEWKIPNAFVSRLGGSTFVMDDGDDKWLRKTTATEGPPEYANLEDGETDGQPDLPHNELIRLRTRTGHQILLHNTEDLIYIGNARGTSWIELSSDGKIDIYAEDSISVHTKQDFNFYADRDFNIEVGRNFNLKVAERYQTEVGMDKICIVNGNVAIQVDGTKDETVTGAVAQSFEATWDVTTGDAVNITTGADLNLNVSGASVVSSSGDFTIKASNTAIDGGNINFNSGIAGDAGTATAATPPEPLTTFENPDEADGTLPESIMLRIPTHEPWPHHENLDPLNFKPEMTDREAGSAIATPDLYKTYSTPLDTFDRQAPPGDEEQ